MALYGTPSLAEFREVQSAGIMGFNYPKGMKSPEKLLDNPNVDDQTKDAVKVNQYAASAVPTAAEGENIIEKVNSGAQPVSKIFTVESPLAEKMNQSLSDKYKTLSRSTVTPDVPFEAGVIDPRRDTSFNMKSFGKQLADKESAGGNYKLKSNVSSAVGKYQFLWNTWKDKIRTVTGVQTKDDFANNPQAQEKFFSWYTNNEVLPSAKKLQAEGAKRGFSLLDLSKLIHFRGVSGTQKLLKWDPKKYEGRDMKNNMGVNEYLGRSVQKGGR